MRLMIKIMNKYKGCELYTDVVEKILGKKAKKFMAAVYIINLFGSLIAYTLVSNMFLMNLIQPALAVRFGYQLDDPHFQRYSQLTGLAILIIGSVPFQMMTTTKIFGKIGFLSIFTLIYILVVTIIQTPDYIAENKPEVKLFNFDNPMMIMQNLGMWTFNTYYLDMIFLVKKDMGKVTEKRLMIVGGSCMIVCVIPYLLFGIVGYLSFGDLALNIDLFPDRPSLAGTDYMMDLVKI